MVKWISARSEKVYECAIMRPRGFLASCTPRPPKDPQYYSADINSNIKWCHTIVCVLYTHRFPLAPCRAAIPVHVCYAAPISNFSCFIVRLFLYNMHSVWLFATRSLQSRSRSYNQPKGSRASGIFSLDDVAIVPQKNMSAGNILETFSARNQLPWLMRTLRSIHTRKKSSSNEK